MLLVDVRLLIIIVLGLVGSGTIAKKDLCQVIKTMSRRCI